MHGHVASVNSVTVLPDGRTVSGNTDHTVRVWDPANTGLVCQFRVEAGVGLLAHYSHPLGVVAGMANGNVIILAIESGRM